MGKTAQRKPPAQTYPGETTIESKPMVLAGLRVDEPLVGRTVQRNVGPVLPGYMSQPLLIGLSAVALAGVLCFALDPSGTTGVVGLGLLGTAFCLLLLAGLVQLIRIKKW